MGKLLVILGCVGFASTLAVGLLAPRRPADQKAGVLQADQLATILEPAPPGSIASTQFTLRNRGDAPLKLSEPTATCGCVEATLSSDLIPPGGETLLRVAIRVPKIGKRRETVTIISDSSVSKVITVAVTAVSNLSPPYVVPKSPPVVFHGWLEPGAERFAAINTVEFDSKEPWLHAFGTDLTFVAVDLAEVITKPAEEGFVRRRYRVRLRLESVPPMGQTTGKLHVTSTRPVSNAAFLDAFSAGPRVTDVPIVIDPAPPVEAHPRSLFATGATKDQGLLIHLRAAKPGFVLSASPREPLPEWIHIETVDSPLDSMRSFRIQISEPTADKAPNDSVVRNEIRFETNHPAMPEVTIPVIYRRTDSAGG